MGSHIDDEAFIPAIFDQSVLRPELDLDAAVAQFMLEGWATTSPVVDAALLERLSAELGDLEPRAGLRNLLDISPAARTLASSMAVRHIPEAVLGAGCFVTRAILFDKTPESNWKVPWHQDLAIAVAERRELPGFGPWSVKDGVVHVQPPTAVLAGMVTVRVHVDDCGLENGPVRVLSRTHDLGKLDPAGIQQLRSSATEVSCTARRGGILAFRPLLLHASSASTNPGRRRVAHFEFAATDLPEGLDWQLRWRSEPHISHPEDGPSRMRGQQAPRIVHTDIP
jgi:ectoine hydroxylase-related dioxygenase (phytanoyl-CoA dioxygenase family)